MRAEDLLPDDQTYVERNGVTIRKGSVGAFLANAKVWCDSSAEAGERLVAERHIAEVVPALRALGLFDVFAIRDPALQQLIDAQ
ncbi:MAG: hypothetical protein GAK35_00612 [Herbaspirillum frisingense]|uniref:Preprotein translocase subunit SecD n=1 Tax=Herbaspirillum frisingense TaxID=92645 RepID=A0A7V8FZN0_9BURK|nr:MAG: hypothetical protein GAK35_00612 [Herbaspirillum frisingense]